MSEFQVPGNCLDTRRFAGLWKYKAEPGKYSTCSRDAGPKNGGWEVDRLLLSRHGFLR